MVDLHEDQSLWGKQKKKAVFSSKVDNQTLVRG